MPLNIVWVLPSNYSDPNRACFEFEWLSKLFGLRPVQGSRNTPLCTETLLCLAEVPEPVDWALADDHDQRRLQ